MRRLITGIDESGKSCVIEEGEVSFADVSPGVGWTLAYEIRENPPPPRPPGRGDHLAMMVDPGLVRWNLVEYQPGLEWPMHHTDSIDLDIVVSGSVELILVDGPHGLSPGDCVVVTGVDHAWRAGTDGCCLSVTTIGTPPLP